MKAIQLVVILLASIPVYGQIPEPDSNPIDTSNAKFIRWKIENETFFINLDTLNGEHFFKRGRLYMDLDDCTSAISDFTTCIKLLPQESAPYYYRGGCYDRLKDFKKSIEDFSKVIELIPAWEGGYLDRATIYTEIGEYNKAELDVMKVMEIKPEWTVAYGNLARIYDKKGDKEKAIEKYNYAIKLDSANHLALNNLGAIYYEKKKFDLAISYYSKAIEKLPNYFNAIRNRADAKIAKGDKQGACNDIKLAASLGDSKAKRFVSAVCN